MSEVNFSDRAESDLVEIWTFIARDDPATADRLIEQIQQTCQMFAKNRRAGRRRPKLHPVIRSFAVNPHVIFYRLSDGGIEVVRVLRGRRDIRDLG